MEEASLKSGIQRIKFTCSRKGTLFDLFRDDRYQNQYLKLARQLADALYLQEQHGLSPVCPDGKVGGNGAVKLSIDDQCALMVSKSGKYPGPMDLHKDFCIVSNFDRDSWSCEYYSANDNAKPTCDTPMHFSVLFSTDIFEKDNSPAAAIHGHGLQSEEEAKKFDIPCSKEETLCSTIEDTDALLRLIEAHPYPRDQAYIRKDHGYYILGQNIEHCLHAFRNKIISNLDVTESSGDQLNSQQVCTDNFASLIPDRARGMKKLDKSIYNVNICLPAIKCKAKSCGKFLAVYKDVLLKRPHFRKIINDPSMGKEYKLILLDPMIHSIDNLNERRRNVIVEEDATFCAKSRLTITYDDFTFNEIIQSIIPEDSESVTSFETVGHIAHVNLREHLGEYKYVIGQVLLDKNVHIKTVVNKTNTINATFRFFEMELLAGEDKMSTSVSEHGCLFEFDYSQVYWNSRLQSEHKRLVDQIIPGDTVFDVFAGVGPFAIPAAKKQCNVFANDLNKVCHDSLLHNAKLNKVSDSIKVFNMDGRAFLNDIVIEKHLFDYKHGNCRIHIVMNLPAIAPDFLDVFKHKYEACSTSVKVESNIIIHCYCFSKSTTPEIEAETNIANIIGLDALSHAKTHVVRRVAPNKVMLCVTFNLLWFEKNPKESLCNDTVLSRKRTLDEDGSAVDAKRPMPIT